MLAEDYTQVSHDMWWNVHACVWMLTVLQHFNATTTLYYNMRKRHDVKIQRTLHNLQVLQQPYIIYNNISDQYSADLPKSKILHLQKVQT